MKKLRAYYLALHDQLEREATDAPDNNFELRLANHNLASQLLQLPGGRDRVADAKRQAKTKHYLMLASLKRD